VTEFRFADRVRWQGTESYGTVIDERRTMAMKGSFQECLPQPVAVLWDDTHEVHWAPGHELELA
jgi:hypothetical protein